MVTYSLLPELTDTRVISDTGIALMGSASWGEMKTVKLLRQNWQIDDPVPTKHMPKQLVRDMD